MKTTTDYENMTDEALSYNIGQKLEMEKIDESPEEFCGCMPGWVYKPYATSLDACREAIEKFLSGGQYLRELYIEFSKVRLEAEAHATLYNWEGGFISYLGEHKNPARAASIAMLKAMEKTNADG